MFQEMAKQTDIKVERAEDTIFALKQWEMSDEAGLRKEISDVLTLTTNMTTVRAVANKRALPLHTVSELSHLSPSSIQEFNEQGSR